MLTEIAPTLEISENFVRLYSNFYNFQRGRELIKNYILYYRSDTHTHTHGDDFSSHQKFGIGKAPGQIKREMLNFLKKRIACSQRSDELLLFTQSS